MKHPRFILATAFVLSTAAMRLHAADFHFNVPTGDWNTAASWLENAVPGIGGGNFAFVNNGGTVNITSTIPVIQDPFIGSGGGTSGTVNHSAGVHSNVGWVFIGEQGGTGAYNLTGPGNTLGSGDLSTGRIYIGGRRGVTAGGTGTMSVNTTGTVTAGSDLSVGTRGGNGTLTITAGTVNANTWFIVGETEGGNGGSTGTVVQNGGNVTGGATDVNGRFWIASQEGAAGPVSNGSYTINNGNLTVRNAIIGKNYTGTFNQNNGIVTINNAANDSRLGEAAGSTGIYNMAGGLLTMGANFQIGASGTGNFNQTGGIVNASNFPVVGRFTGGTGTLNISSGSFNQTDAGTAMIVGEAGTGTINVSGSGAVTAQNNLLLGTEAGGTGNVNQTGGTVSVVNTLDLQNLGTGTYLLDGGTLSVNGTVDDTAGAFIFTGGVLTRSNAGTINYLGNLLVGQNDATLKLDNNKLFAVSGNLGIVGGVTFDLNGDLLPVYSGSGVDYGSIPLGTDGSITGTFDPLTTLLLNLGNTAGATYISEIAGETSAYSVGNESVYWVQENAGGVTLNWSIVPEPSIFASLLGGLGMLTALQRRRRA